MPQVCKYYLIFLLRINLYSLVAGVTISSGKYRTNTVPVLSSISCIGSESYVKDCIFGSVGTLSCGHDDKDAVISCLNGKNMKLEFTWLAAF